MSASGPCCKTSSPRRIYPFRNRVTTKANVAPSTVSSRRRRRAALAVRLRQDVAGADVEQEAREEAQIDRQPGVGNREQHRRERAQHRAPSHPPAACPTRADDRYCWLTSISVTVFSPSEKSCATTAMATTMPTAALTLKAQADADAVEKAVARERQRREHPDGRVLVISIVVLVRVVNEHALFGDVEQQKAARPAPASAPR